MISKYTDAQILKALDEIGHDKNARDALWKDICGVTAKHVNRWVTLSEQQARNERSECRGAYCIPTIHRGKQRGDVKRAGMQ
jgi:hypothetical protein